MREEEGKRRGGGGEEIKDVLIPTHPRLWEHTYCVSWERTSDSWKRQCPRWNGGRNVQKADGSGYDDFRPCSSVAEFEIDLLSDPDHRFQWAARRIRAMAAAAQHHGGVVHAAKDAADNAPTSRNMLRETNAANDPVRAATMPFAKKLSLPWTEFRGVVSESHDEPAPARGPLLRGAARARFCEECDEAPAGAGPLVHLVATYHHALGRQHLLDFRLDLATTGGCAVMVAGKSVPKFMEEKLTNNFTLFDSLRWTWEEREPTAVYV